MTVAKAIARAWADADYKAKLLGDPQTALSEVGIDVPAGTNIKVTESTVNNWHIVLPPAPDDTLSEDELENVAGGTYVCTTCCI